MSYKRIFTKSKPSLKKKSLPFDEGILFFSAKTKNLHLNLTDMTGRIFIASSGGQEGFKNTLKKTTLAAETVVQRVVEEGILRGLKKVHVKCRGFHMCRNTALRFLVNQFSHGNLEILDFEDSTRLPHGGCRPRKLKSN